MAGAPPDDRARLKLSELATESVLGASLSAVPTSCSLWPDRETSGWASAT